MRCCGVSVSSLTGTTTLSEPRNRISKAADQDDNSDGATEATSETTTQENSSEWPTTPIADSNDAPTEIYSTTFEPSADDTSTESTTITDDITTTEVSPVVHHDGEIIDNVVIYYPSEMSGKRKAKPNDMPLDANEFRIHDDGAGTDLHLIFPSNQSAAIVTAQPMESTTNVVETKPATTTTNAPKFTVELVTPSHASSTTDAPSTVAVAMAATEAATVQPLKAEPSLDLKSEGSELANQIENVTVKRPRYKRRRLKIKPYTPKPLTTVPTTPTAPPEMQPSERTSSVQTDAEQLVPSTPVPDDIEPSTRKSYPNRFNLFRSRNRPTNVLSRNMSMAGVAVDHERKINALHNTLTETMNLTSGGSIPDFLIQRRQSEQSPSVKPGMLAELPAPQANRTPTKSITFATASTEATTDTSEKNLIESRNTTTAPVSLRERFNRRRPAFRRVNRLRDHTSSTTTTTTTAKTTATTLEATETPTTTPIPKSTQSNEVRNIRTWYRRRPSHRFQPIKPIVTDSVAVTESSSIARNVQKIRKIPNIDRPSDSRRKQVEALERRRPTSTTESSAGDSSLATSRSKLSETTADPPAQSSPTRRYRRRRTTTIAPSTTTATTTTLRPTTAAAHSEEDKQAFDIDAIESTTIRRKQRPTTTTTTSTTTTAAPFQTSQQTNSIESQPKNRMNGAVAFEPTQSTEAHTTNKRPHVPVIEQPQPMRTQTFPDMNLPHEAKQPFHREPTGTGADWPVTSLPPAAVSIPLNHLGESSLYSEQLLRPLRTLQPANGFPGQFVQSSVPLRYSVNIPGRQPAAVVPQRYYIPQNGPFQRFAGSDLNAMQFPNRYVGQISQTAPSPYQNFNFPFNFN